MADPDALLNLYGSLSNRGYPDLDAFSKTIAVNDPWKMAAAPILGTQFDQSKWSNGQRFGVNALQAFLGNALSQWGNVREAQQTEAVNAILPQLLSDPLNTARPEGVDQQAFANLQMNTLKNQAVNRESVIRQLLGNNPEMTANLLGLGPKRTGTSITEPVATETDDPAERLRRNLSRTGKTTEDKFKEKFNTYIAQGIPKQQASVQAREEVAAEIKANAKSFDEAKAAREAGQKLIELAQTAKAGMETAGDTGEVYTPLTQLADFLTSSVSPAAAARREGKRTLESIGPDVIRTNKTPGNVTEYETKLFLKGGPNLGNTRATNEIIATKMEQLGQINLDYADFIEAYRDANSGSTVGADKLWQQYKSAYPLFKTVKGDIQLNTDKPSWQEFFSVPESQRPPTQAQIQAELRRRGLIK